MIHAPEQTQVAAFGFAFRNKHPQLPPGNAAPRRIKLANRLHRNLPVPPGKRRLHINFNAPHRRHILQKLLRRIRHGVGDSGVKLVQRVKRAQFAPFAEGYLFAVAKANNLVPQIFRIRRQHPERPARVVGNPAPKTPRAERARVCTFACAFVLRRDG